MSIRHLRIRRTWQWLLLLFTVAGFVETAFYAQVNAFTPLYLPQIGVPVDQVRAWTGLIATISSALGIPFLPLWGALADRFARKPIIIRSFVAEMLAALLMAVAPGVGYYLLGRTITSLSLGNSGLMMTTLTERTPKRRAGLAFSIMNGAPGVGLFLGPLFGGLLLDRYGFQTVLYCNAAMLFAVILSLSLGYRDDYRGTVSGSVARMAVDTVSIIWGTMRLRTLLIALFLLFAGRSLVFSYVPLCVTALYEGSSPGTAVGLASAAAGLAAIALSPAFGLLADRFGHWRVLFGGAIALAILWPLPALARNLEQFVALWAVLSGTAAGVLAISFSVLSASAPAAARARVMTFAYLPVVLGSTFGPALGAVVTRNSVFAVFPVAGAVAVGGVIALAYAGRYQVREAVA